MPITGDTEDTMKLNVKINMYTVLSMCLIDFFVVTSARFNNQ